MFNELAAKYTNKIKSTSAIHCFLIAGNENALRVSKQLKDKGFDVRAIKSPTVKEGSERLRICLHATNTKEELISLSKALEEIF